ncbi:MAG: helix-turn-helix domain-containing protein [Propionibacteriales bacterium]|nr:helix-turn-helix domain-containing protein [Propionibacteriales bacterium]
MLAHPLRSRLLGLLRLEGAATATTLARALDTNTGATSYHLRKLAGVGLVEDTEEGQGRERVWRAAHDMHSWSSASAGDDPDARAAGDWLQGNALRWFTEQAERWTRELDQWSDTWRDGGGTSDYFLRLTAAQLLELNQELYAVIERYIAAGPASDDDARRVMLFLHTFPEGDPA